MAAFQKAVESGDPDLGAKAYYNLGNALYRQQQFDQAVASYEKSLGLNPSDRDAKINLEMALEKLEEQQQEQNQQQDNQNQDENNDDQQEQEKNDQQQDQQEPENNDQNSNPDDPQDQNESQSQPQQPGELSPEEAERLLDALKDREADSQKRRRIRLQGKRYRGKPW